MLDPAFETARSDLPSPLKSPAASPSGLWPTAMVCAAGKLPSPRPNNTETVVDAVLAAARSGAPSPLKSPAATAHEMLPMAKVRGAWRLPSPLPSSTETVLDPSAVPSRSFATATSSLPSLLKSPGTVEVGPRPAAKPTPNWKVPSPLPSSTETVSAPVLAATRSGLASPLKSPTATDQTLSDVARGEEQRRLERSVAVALQHRDPARPRVGDRQIGLAVPIEVSDRDEERTTVHREASRRLERAIAVAEQHDNRVGSGVGDGQIRPAVAIEVAGGHGAWANTCPNGHGRLKRSVTVAEEQCDGVASGVGNGQIRPAVPVEVRDRHRLRTGALPEVHRFRGLERSVAVANQHRGGVVAGIREREILHEVAVEIARRDRRRTMSGRVVPVGREVNRLRRHGRGKHLEQQERGNTQRYPRACLGHGDHPLVKKAVSKKRCGGSR